MARLLSRLDSSARAACSASAGASGLRRAASLGLGPPELPSPGSSRLVRVPRPRQPTTGAGGIAWSSATPGMYGVKSLCPSWKPLPRPPGATGPPAGWLLGRKSALEAAMRSRLCMRGADWNSAASAAAPFSACARPARACAATPAVLLSCGPPARAAGSV